MAQFIPTICLSTDSVSVLLGKVRFLCLRWFSVQNRKWCRCGVELLQTNNRKTTTSRLLGSKAKMCLPVASDFQRDPCQVSRFLSKGNSCAEKETSQLEIRGHEDLLVGEMACKIVVFHCGAVQNSVTHCSLIAPKLAVCATNDKVLSCRKIIAFCESFEQRVKSSCLWASPLVLAWFACGCLERIFGCSLRGSIFHGNPLLELCSHWFCPWEFFSLVIPGKEGPNKLAGLKIT